MEPFDHGFTPDSLKSPNGFEVIGYNKAMGQVLDYLKEVTQFKPANRMIDSVPLIEKIGATFIELSKLHKDIEDEVKTAILSGTKPEKTESHFINSILEEERKKFPPVIEVCIDTSNNPHGRYELSVVANDEILGKYYYDEREDADADCYALEYYFEVSLS